MNDLIAHRGPDDSGVYHDPATMVGLAHRRLSIIDLSPLGRQPMWDATGSVAVVFNGEIYNYREQREVLTAQGYKFQSVTDTEVLLNLYLRDGFDMLNGLNGIFAFGMYDTRDRSLFVARDGLGVKPLYYAESPKGFIFSSELKALLLDPSVPRDIDASAVHNYITFLWCPAPATILKQVKKLEPGWALKVRGGAVVATWQFYELPYGRKIEKLSVQEAAIGLRNALDVAVKRQMVSDAPLGAFLSGGLDSSSVAAIARKYTNDEPLKCFTIKLRGIKVEGFRDDSEYARQMAKNFGAQLHVIEADGVVPSDLPKMVFHLDEPQADPAAMLVLQISRLARNHGVKVLLSGVGGDDILCGYRRHVALAFEKYWAWLPPRVRRVIRDLTGKLPVSRPSLRRFRKAFEYADLSESERIHGYFKWVSPTWAATLYGPQIRDGIANGNSFSNGLLASLQKLPKHLSAMNRLLFLDAKHFLTDHNLNYTDKMSMAEGVEVRVPFLDVDLIAFVVTLPDQYKQRGFIGKWILRNAMETYLPKSVLNRPKTGFMVPIRSWFQNPVPEFLKDLLSEATVAKRQLFDPAGVQRMIEMNSRGLIDAAYPLLAIACVELWLQSFVDRSVPAQLTP